MPVTEGQKYFSGVPHVGNPALKDSSWSEHCNGSCISSISNNINNNKHQKQQK
jgi:hypothetical protein